MSSLIQKIDSQGTLGNPIKLLRIADAATKAVTVDPGLGSVGKLLGMASGYRHLHSKNVTFVTMPTIPDPADTNRLLPNEPQDDLMWQMLKTDTVWHGALPAPSPRQVQVAVLNGTGMAGLAGQAAAGLKKLGFDVVSVGNAPVTTATTSISYPGTAAAGAAYVVGRALTGTSASQNTATQNTASQNTGSPGTGSAGPVTLTIGSDFTGITPPPAPAKAGAAHAPAASQQPSAGQQAAVESRNAAQNICSGVPGANPNP
jgi:hypothetical protein